MALTANAIPRYKGSYQLQNSGITDDGSAVVIAHPTTITGNSTVTGTLDVTSTIKGAAGLTLAGTIVGVTTAITGVKNNKLTISVPNQTADAAGLGIEIKGDAGAVGARNGGSITLTPGAKSGAGTDGSVVINGAWTAAGKTCADLGTVTTAVISAGTVDATIGGNTPAAVTGTTITANTNLSTAGNTIYTAVAKGPLLKRGANGHCGTFIATEGTPVSVASNVIAITDCIFFSLNAIGGTVGAYPKIATITAGVGFTVVCSAGDTSTYNWAAISNAA